MNKIKFFILLLASSISIVGCSNDAFEKEEQRVKNVKEENKLAADDTKEDKKKDKMYQDMEKPLDEVILENDLDPATEVESIETTKKEHFVDAAEFSKYTADILYKFYTLAISPEEYYDFLMNYGSIEVIKELPTKKDAIVILSTIQEMYRNQNITGESYTITNIEFDRFNRNGTYYRKLLTTNGEEYFITTITKEDTGWKYVEDSPSPPYTEMTAEEGSKTEKPESIKEGESGKNANSGS